jgi:hypothetical protein
METTMTILNLTQHISTPTQREAGVVDLPAEARARLTALLTVEDIPTEEDLHERSMEIFCIAEEWCALAREAGVAPGSFRAMVGGAAPLVRLLRLDLKARGVKPLEAFSRRHVVETTLPDGSVRKTVDFVHAGWWPDVD